MLQDHGPSLGNLGETQEGIMPHVNKRLPWACLGTRTGMIKESEGMRMSLGLAGTGWP